MSQRPQSLQARSQHLPWLQNPLAHCSAASQGAPSNTAT
jgi:hypothetical protein